MQFAFSVGLLLFVAAQDGTLIAEDSTTQSINDSSPISEALLDKSTSSPSPLTSTSSGESTQCVVGLERDGSYSCGAICKNFKTTDIGTCPSNPEWSTADIDGTCGATVDAACHIAVSKAQDPTSATCGKCYAMTKKVGATSKTIFTKVVSVADLNQPLAKFQLPSAVFHATCPILCNKGGCALAQADCASLGGVGVFDDCVVPNGVDAVSIEKYDIKLVNCDGENADGVGSSMALSLASLTLAHYFLL